MSMPLVSCIMPTWNRREFVPQAIKYFLGQDYPNKELLILDDGEPGPTPAIPFGVEVFYSSSDHRRTLGAKRNALVRLSRGDLVAHWHDDDWNGPQRLSRQVAAMQGGAPICGLDTVLFHDLPTDKTYIYHYGFRSYLFCSTTMYQRSFWEALHFPDQDVQSSSPFIWPANNPHRLDGAVLMQDADWFVGMVHLDNHNPKVYAPPCYQLWSGDVSQVVGADWPFYELLRANLPARQPGRGGGKTPPMRQVV